MHCRNVHDIPYIVIKRLQNDQRNTEWNGIDARFQSRYVGIISMVCLSVCPCPSVRLTLYRLNLGNGKSHGKQTLGKDDKP